MVTTEDVTTVVAVVVVGLTVGGLGACLLAGLGAHL